MKIAVVLLAIVWAAVTLWLMSGWLRADARADTLAASFAVSEAAHIVLVDSLEANISERDSAVVAIQARVAHSVQRVDTLRIASDSVAVEIVRIADTTTARLFVRYRATVDSMLGEMRAALKRADSVVALIRRNEQDLRVELAAERALRFEAQAVAIAQAKARRPGVVGWITRGLAAYAVVRVGTDFLAGKP